MAINKVVYGGDTLIDLTSDTVTPPKLKIGAVAHAANGSTIEGELAGVYYGTTAPSPSDAPVWIDPSGTANTIGTEDVKYKIYNSVEDVGLSSGEATIVSAFSAMPACSMLFVSQTDFISSSLPNNFSGIIEIIRGLSAASSYIEAKGWQNGIKDWRMFLNSNNTPTGEWLLTNYDSGEYIINNSISVHVKNGICIVRIESYEVTTNGERSQTFQLPQWSAPSSGLYHSGFARDSNSTSMASVWIDPNTLLLHISLHSSITLPRTLSGELVYAVN